MGLVGAAIVAMIWGAIGSGPPTGTIILNVTPPDRADLRLDIDGRQQVVTSGGETRLTIPAGAHVVRVTCPAYVGFEQRIDVAADQTTAVRVQLRPVARVTITLPRDRPANFRISFNGRAQPLPSGLTLVVPCNPGTHVVRATSDQGDFEHSVTVVENQNRLVTIPNRDDKRLTGRWIGAVEVDAQAVERKLKDSQANALQRLVTQGLVAGLATGRLEIELQPDGVYRAQVQLGPLSSQSAGQWTILDSARRMSPWNSNRNPVPSISVASPSSTKTPSRRIFQARRRTSDASAAGGTSHRHGKLFLPRHSGCSPSNTRNNVAAPSKAS